MTDEEHAAAIKGAVEALNSAVSAAAEDGVEVEISDLGEERIGRRVQRIPFFIGRVRRQIEQF
jgi:hypothetical protein